MQQALIYCRVSTEEQAVQGYSLDTQEKFCRRFAESNGLQPVAVYRDEGRSGTSLARPGLSDLLAHAKRSDISAVVVQETDRLARNTQDHLMIKGLLRDSGVRLIAVAQPMLDDSPEGNMIDTIIASVNQFQSDANSRKTTKGLQERFEGGWWPGWAPIGYLNAVTENEQRIVVPDPTRFRHVKRVLQLYATGNYSADELAADFHRKGLTSRTGKVVCNQVMMAMLKNPFYAGIMVWKGERRAGKHRPMITIEEHERILNVVASHNMHASRSRKHRFLLSGFVFCAICGGRYTAEHHSVKRLSYYHCDFKAMRGPAKPHTNRGQNVQTDDLEQQVADHFKRIEFSDRAIDLVLTRVRAVHADEQKDVQVEKRVLLNQRLGIERRRDIAEEKLFSGLISDADFVRIKGKINAELAAIESELAEKDRDRDSEVDVLRQVLVLARDIGRAYQKASAQLRRHFLGLFWERFLVRDKGIVEAIPTRLIKALVASNQVTIRGEKRDLPLCNRVMISDVWLPSPALLITLRDAKYMAGLRSHLTKIDPEAHPS